MVAALYGVVEPDEIESSEDLCGCLAVTLLLEGLTAVHERAVRLRASESCGGVEAPEFLDDRRDPLYCNLGLAVFDFLGLPHPATASRALPQHQGGLPGAFRSQKY